jgi:nucleotide-binding universal stress UspA family protein
MSEKKKLIVATDLSKDARPAAEWARGFGEIQGAQVIVLHVVELSAAHWVAGAFDYLDDPELQKKAEDNVRNWYVDATGSEPDGVEVRAGTAAVQIGEAVTERGADLLVVSRSGKRGWERFLLGSTAKALAIDPPCELVVVHPEHANPDVKDIVVGTDFSRNADRAVSAACELARRYGATLHIVHSEDVEDVDAIDALGGATIPTEYRRTDVEIEASKRLKKLEKDHAGELEGVKYETKLSREEPGRALIAYCERNKSDLLVVGRAGHSPLVANVLGSAVNRVVHGSPTTLLICPAS